MDKMTYVKALTAVIEGKPMTDEVKEKLIALRTAQEKRNSGSKSLTKNQKANEVVKQAILDFLSDSDTEWFTVSSIIKTAPVLEGLTTQKVSPMLNGLVKDGKLQKSEGKPALFALPSVTADPRPAKDKKEG